MTSFLHAELIVENVTVAVINVFKGSKTAAKIAIQMDKDGPGNELQNEDCYSDAAQK